MGIETAIEWCDSTANGQEGCDGCELWSRKSGGTCYAAALVKRWGPPAHPQSFGEPELYPSRIGRACRWRDLSGQVRPEKPWLDGLPRLIFFDDLGDTFTERLDDEAHLRLMIERRRLMIGRRAESGSWLALHQLALAAVEGGGHWLDPWIEEMAESPHIWILLTKRPRRMRQFFRRMGCVPSNFWLLTSVTSRANVGRLDELLRIPEDLGIAPGDRGVYGVSYEPILEPVDLTPYLKGGLSWVILGGESGPGARACGLSAMRSVIDQATPYRSSIFVKQLGANPRGLRLKDRKGGDWSEWPRDLMLREVPGGRQVVLEEGYRRMGQQMELFA